MQHAKNALNRRTFVGGAGALGLTALSSLGTTPAPANAEETAAPVIAETIDCDIVIVGAGISGLAAAVEAGEAGANVVLIEAESIPGGNGLGVEACFGNGSKMQLEAGIEAYDPGEIIRHEMKSSQWRAYGPDYVDMINNSGNNIDWMVEHGVQFMYVTPGLSPSEVMADKATCHYFEGGVAAEGYVPFMAAAAEAAGVVARYETKAQQLVFDEAGKVAGVVATNLADGTNVQVNAKAVILATGGFPHNPELLKEMRVREEDVELVFSVAHCDGTGHNMALSAGAESYVSNAVLLAELLIPGSTNPFQGGILSRVVTNTCPTAIWINDACQRFVAEDFISENLAFMVLPTRNYKQTYILFDQAGFDAAYEAIAGTDMVRLASMDVHDELQQAVDAGGVVKADSIEELAAAAGLDPETLRASVDRYNGFAAAGKDADYSKSGAFVTALDAPPFYLATTKLSIMTAIGSIYTDSNFNALTPEREPIDNLYVVGVEGARLWASCYTIDVSGGCCANNVNSGRTAARHAMAHCL